jgi:hypothetical protein
MLLFSRASPAQSQKSSGSLIDEPLPSAKSCVHTFRRSGYWQGSEGSAGTKANSQKAHQPTAISFDLNQVLSYRTSMTRGMGAW